MNKLAQNDNKILLNYLLIWNTDCDKRNNISRVFLELFESSKID